MVISKVGVGRECWILGYVGGRGYYGGGFRFKLYFFFFRFLGWCLMGLFSSIGYMGIRS